MSVVLHAVLDPGLDGTVRNNTRHKKQLISLLLSASSLYSKEEEAFSFFFIIERKGTIKINDGGRVTFNSLLAVHDRYTSAK